MPNSHAKVHLRTMLQVMNDSGQSTSKMYSESSSLPLDLSVLMRPRRVTFQSTMPKHDSNIKPPPAEHSARMKGLSRILLTQSEAIGAGAGGGGEGVGGEGVGGEGVGAGVIATISSTSTAMAPVVAASIPEVSFTVLATLNCRSVAEFDSVLFMSPAVESAGTSMVTLATTDPASSVTVTTES